MSKASITRLFVGGILAVVAGIAMVAIAALVAVANSLIQLDGPTGFAIDGSAAWIAVALVITGLLAVLGGSIAGLVAWIGALINTFQIEDKMWFILLLVLGLWNFGFLAMLFYVMIGPDGMRKPMPISATGPTAAVAPPVQ
jgi:hypothetical protein